MTFGEKLKNARIEAGLKQSELADKLETTSNTISNWENNVSKPDLDKLSYICGALHVNASYFLQAKIPDDEVSITELNLIKSYRFLDNIGKEHVNNILEWETKRVQVLAEKDKQLSSLQSQLTNLKFQNRMRLYTYLGKIACAGTGFYFDDIPTDTIEAPYMNGADFIIGVSGDSMEPNYHDGEKLYVQKAKELTLGDIGIFTIRNECFVKELGEHGLISKNPNYDDIWGNEDVRLIGRVLGKVEFD